MNNIICIENFLANLLYKFRNLFKIFLHYNISIKSTKSHLNSLDVGFLDQQVNSLELITWDKKF